MLREMKAILYYFAVDLRFSFIVFWSILVASLTVLYMLSLSFDTVISASTSIGIYIFCGITGFLMTKETFPYCIKLGATRNSYLLSTIVYFAGVALVMSLVHLVILSVFKALGSLGFETNFNILLTVQGTALSDTWYNQFFLDALFCFFLISMGFMLGTILYRLGLVGIFSTLALLAVIIIVPTTREWLVEIFVSLEGSKLVINYILVVLLALLTFLPNWGMLRKAQTVPGTTR